MSKASAPRIDYSLKGYRDNGCEISPSCETCPLEKCKYDFIDEELDRKKQYRRDQAIRQRYHRLMACYKKQAFKTLSDEFKVTIRNLYRILEENQR